MILRNEAPRLCLYMYTPLLRRAASGRSLRCQVLLEELDPLTTSPTPASVQTHFPCLLGSYVDGGWRPGTTPDPVRHSCNYCSAGQFCNRHTCMGCLNCTEGVYDDDGDPTHPCVRARRVKHRIWARRLRACARIHLQSPKRNGFRGACGIICSCRRLLQCSCSCNC